MQGKPVIHLVCGSTGAGKTTFSIRLAEQEGALRLSIDEWMVTLFGPDQPQPIEFAWMMERIGRCEMQMWAMALQAAKRGVGSVIDCGLTRADHRRKFANLAREAGLPVALHHLDTPAEERWLELQEDLGDAG